MSQELLLKERYDNGRKELLLKDSHGTKAYKGIIVLKENWYEVLATTAVRS